MAKFIIPNEVVEQESGAGRSEFPEGTWEGSIETVRIQIINQEDPGDFFLKNKDGVFFADQCEKASMQVGSNVAMLEGQPITDKRIDKLAEAAYEQARPVANVLDFSPRYRRDMVRVYVKMAVKQALAGAGAKGDS